MIFDSFDFDAGVEFIPMLPVPGWRWQRSPFPIHRQPTCDGEHLRTKGCGQRRHHRHARLNHGGCVRWQVQSISKVRHLFYFVGSFLAGDEMHSTDCLAEKHIPD